ncbi:MAG: hypothetical protein J7K00_04975 [Candidatus Diapherotrites archaeon]|nr:hypothetical protein [Candidatus Diapherotrites archaeon]
MQGKTGMMDDCALAGAGPVNSGFMTYVASAPTRLDLAGGTLDIWPIYVLENGAVTVNAAISIRAESRLEIRKDKKIRIFSKDNSKSVESENLFELKHDELGLVTRIIEYFKPEFGFNLETSIGLPAGTGLGASSSLGISLMHLFNRLTEKNLGDLRIIDVLSNIEAQEISVNTGKQDYFAATYGKINAIHLGVEGERLEELKISDGFKNKLCDCFVLCFTGDSRFSAANNWNMIKNYMEARNGAKDSMAGINDAGCGLKYALENEEFDTMVRCIKQEAFYREKLAEEVVTSKMKAIIDNAEKNGAIASKPLGAGGGGCILFVCAEGTRNKVIDAIERCGGKNIDFGFESVGVTVKKVVDKGDS